MAAASSTRVCSLLCSNGIIFNFFFKHLCDSGLIVVFEKSPSAGAVRLFEDTSIVVATIDESKLVFMLLSAQTGRC